MSKDSSSNIHGWLLVDKPSGMSSAAVVGRIKYLTKQKIGHAGTLDPLATGILPLAIGEATKTAGYVTCADKAYRFTIMWGQSTDTEDKEGKVVARSEKNPTESEIQSAIQGLVGPISQVPPQFSAIKVNGKRAYAMARAGQEVELKAREVHIYSFKLIGCKEAEAEFEVYCSKGTYVRSLARDLAGLLGVCGHIGNLRRIKLGAFEERDTISLDKCEELVHNGALETVLLPMDKLLDDIPVLSVSEEQAKQLRFGQVIPVSCLLVSSPNDELEVRVKHQNKLIGFGVFQGGMLKPKRIINQ